MTIIDNAATSPLYFAYLVACHANLFTYWCMQKIYVEVYHPTCFCRQLRFNQQLLKAVNSHLLVETTLTEANAPFWECMRCLIGSNLVRNVIVHYAHWWHGVARANCTAGQNRRCHPYQVEEERGLRAAQSNWKIRHSLGSFPHPKGKGGEVEGSEPGPRKPQRPCLSKAPI